jgi:hypothetical protein
MRFLITAGPGPEGPKDSNAHQPVDDATFSAYMRFNEEMHRAGILVACEGVNPAGKGARVVAKRGKRAVVDGPYAESKELVGGFYLIDVGSLDEAIAWALRCPTGLGADDELTIHPLTEESDIPPKHLQLVREAAPMWSATFIKERR